MALKVVGSNPIIHPRKDTRLDTISSLVFLFYVEIMPGFGCYFNFFVILDFVAVWCSAEMANGVEKAIVQ